MLLNLGLYPSCIMPWSDTSCTGLCKVPIASQPTMPVLLAYEALFISTRQCGHQSVHIRHALVVD